MFVTDAPASGKLPRGINERNLALDTYSWQILPNSPPVRLMKSPIYALPLLCLALAVAHPATAAPEAPAFLPMAQAELRRVAGPELTRLATDPATAPIAEWMVNSPAVLDGLLVSGPLPDDPEKMVRVLADLRRQDPAGLDDPADLGTALAVALTFGQKSWPEDKAFDRYAFFRDSRRQGLLHPVFGTLEPWEKRYVVSAGGNGGYGGWDDASLVWLRDHVKLPIDAYPGACWQAPYRLHNLFGDSIHGSEYYAPFGHMIHAERVREIGGVCGSLSHFGATAARANGIPAITMGEPGHCAYAVRLARGQWTPAYSLSWQRGLHTSLWGHTWTELVLQDLAMADRAARLASTMALWEARAATDPAVIEAAYRKAIAAQPVNLPVWKEATEFLKSKGTLDAAAWLVLRDQALAALAPWPEAAWTALSGFLAPAMAATPSGERVGFLLAYHFAIADQAGPVPWDFPRALNAQADSLGQDPQAALLFFEQVLAIQAGSASWFAPTIAWGQERFGKNPATTEAYFATLGKVFSSGSASANKDGLRAALRPAVLSASAADNVEAFQALGKAGASLREPGTFKADPFPGELLTSGGLLKVSSTSGWDSPEYHWGVLEEGGGSFHTESEVRAHAIVRLGKLGELTGIIIGNSGGGQNGPRQIPLKVSISEDGQAWTPVFRAETNEGQWRIPLEGKAPRVQFIKVERDDDRREFFHLQAIHAYGRRLQ